MFVVILSYSLFFFILPKPIPEKEVNLLDIKRCHQLPDGRICVIQAHQILIINSSSPLSIETRLPVINKSSTTTTTTLLGIKQICTVISTNSKDISDYLSVMEDGSIELIHTKSSKCTRIWENSWIPVELASIGSGYIYACKRITEFTYEIHKHFCADNLSASNAMFLVENNNTSVKSSTQ